MHPALKLGPSGAICRGKQAASANYSSRRAEDSGTLGRGGEWGGPAAKVTNGKKEASSAQVSAEGEETSAESLRGQDYILYFSSTLYTRTFYKFERTNLKRMHFGRTATIKTWPLGLMWTTRKKYNSSAIKSNRRGNGELCWYRFFDDKFRRNRLIDCNKNTSQYTLNISTWIKFRAQRK